MFSSEVFSYIKNWKELLKVISLKTKYFMISLFIPDNPIGFIKSEKELANEIDKYFEIIEYININKSQFVIIFAKGKL